MDTNNKNAMLVGVGVLIVLVLIGFAWWYRSTSLPVTTVPTDQEITLTGTQICLPHTDTTGPQTLECAIGLKTTDANYALDISAVQNDFSLVTGEEQVTVKGLFTPVEALSSDQWQKYNMKGIVRVTAVLAVDRTVVFSCNSTKSITATFHLKDDTKVDLRLSDGRSLSVPHVTAASGARYANADETFVFWTKGSTAFITEGTNKTETFSNCGGTGFDFKG